MLHHRHHCVVNRPGTMDPSVPASLLVTYDLTTRGYYNQMVIFNTLNGQLNSGYVDRYRVTPLGFTFRQLSGKPRHNHNHCFRH